MTLWSVAKLFEAIRYSVLSRGFAQFDRLKDVEHSIFLASTAYRLTKRANQLTAKEVWGTNMQLYVTLHIVSIGKSSFSFDIVVYDQMSGTQLMSSSLTFVYVNLITRKPTPFPAWINKWKEAHNFGSPRPRLATPSVPENAFKYDVKACYSDLDDNGHVNNSIFVKWCTDAGVEAATHGVYRDFKADLGLYPVHQVEIKYIGEGNVNDKFEIITWQDKTIPKTVHFVVMKAGKVAIVVKFTFLETELQYKIARSPL